MDEYRPQYDMTKLPPPMFPGLVRGYGFEPTAEEMDKAAEAVKYSKVVKITGYHVFTFDLSQTGQAKDYSNLYMAMYARAKAGEIVIHMFERRFVESPSPRWLAHIEYSEYELEKTDRTERTEDEKEGAA